MTLSLDPTAWPPEARLDLRTRMNWMQFDGNMSEMDAREAAERDTRRVWEAAR